jgi:hypothetical protein
MPHLSLSSSDPTADPPAGPSPSPMSPGDEAPPGTGENVCRHCGGSGRIAGRPCPACEGSGRVTVGIGGA